MTGELDRDSLARDLYSRFTIFSLDSKFRLVCDPIELYEVLRLLSLFALVLKSSSDCFLDL